MGTPPIIRWIIADGHQRRATEYTSRLLSSLIGGRAEIVPHADTAAQHPTVYYGDHATNDDSASLRITPDRAFWHTVEQGGDPSPVASRLWRDIEFPIWDRGAAAAVGRDTAVKLCPVDPIAAAFFLVSRIEEWRSKASDQHGRFPAKRSWLVRHGLIETPVVHDYAAAIAGSIGLKTPFDSSRANWCHDRRFAVAFTHDIDQLRMHGPLWQDVRRSIGALRFAGGRRTTAKRFRSRALTRDGRQRDPYDTVDQLSQWHARNGNRATFFLINTKPSATDADYSCGEPRIQSLIRSLTDQGHEVGLHGSYSSFDHPERLGQEKSGLERIVGAESRVTRQHYLRFAPQTTWPAHIASGFKIDSTLGHAERFGFRAGLAVPFRPWDYRADAPFDLWELPLVMMDVTAREYMMLTPQEAIERSDLILRQIARVGGAAAVLWHNSSFDDIDWHGWADVYRAWLSEAARLEGYSATVSEIVQSWRDYLDTLAMP
ncbi:MAG TPA: polysaccharide deacetylase family protein [candidate division Zixibacteria bacterium]|jgi:peptidoglycan/xylan/chitin deacetylase (PgdA/CDA1 family)